MTKAKKKPPLGQVIRSALRRVWFYGEQRKSALARAKIKGHPFWCCEQCFNVTRKPEVDHRVPIGSTPVVGDAGWADFISRLFCPPHLLDVLCATCHRQRTNAQRRSRT